MLVSSPVAGLNHLLADASWARERLAPFAGRPAVFAVKPDEIGAGVDNDGYFTEAVTAEPDVSLELPLASLPKAIGGVDALVGDIRISGNADFADALGFERAGRFGERDEGVPLAAGTSVDKQYFHNCGYFMQKQPFFPLPVHIPRRI